MAQQYKVPQNLDIEDKIIGPFTLKQFLYILGGAVACYFIYVILAPYGLTTVILADFPVAALTVAIVFVKINERPFTFFLMSFVTFVSRPQEFIWGRFSGQTDIKMSTGEKMVIRRKEVKKISKGDEGVKSKLERLSMIVDARGWGADESTGEQLSGRVISSPSEKQEIKITLPQETELEDVFAKFENSLSAGMQEEEEASLSNTAKSLQSLLSEKSRQIDQKIKS